MNIFDIFAAAKFEYAVYSNLAATSLLLVGHEYSIFYDSTMQGGLLGPFLTFSLETNKSKIPSKNNDF